MQSNRSFSDQALSATSDHKAKADMLKFRHDQIKKARQLSEPQNVIGNDRASDYNNHSWPPKQMILVFRFLQLLCENHNEENQHQMSQQNQDVNDIVGISPSSVHDIDLVTLTVEYFETVCKPEILGRDEENHMEVATQVLETLIEYVQGPCKVKCI